MILADTSAWVEFHRATGSEANVRLRDLLDGGELLTTDVVLMELLAGAPTTPTATSFEACWDAVTSPPPTGRETTRPPRTCTGHAGGPVTPCER